MKKTKEESMNKTKNANLTHNSKELRKNMTEDEQHLWYDFLKDLPVTFNRQKVIGPYIVDFYCATAKLVIELDGWQHWTEEVENKDRERDAYLKNLGITVIRYSNTEIKKEFNAVCNDILMKLKEAMDKKYQRRG